MTLAAESAPAKIDVAVVEQLHLGARRAGAVDHHHVFHHDALDGSLTLAA